MTLKNILSIFFWLGVISVSTLCNNSSGLASGMTNATAANTTASSTAQNSNPELKAAPNKEQKQSQSAKKPYSLVKLANGLSVAVLEDERFPLVSVRLFVHAGSAYESPEQSGVSHFLEHMVFKGTSNFPKGAISSTVESAGGYLNAGTSFDYTVYQTDMPAKEWKIGLKVVQEMAFNATLDPAEIEPEKDVVIAEMKRGEDAPNSRLFKMVQKHSLAGTPYERPVIGFESTVRAITSESLRAYIKSLYQPQSMLLLVCGNIKQAEVLAEAKTLFGALENSADVYPPTPSKAEPVRGVNITQGPWNKVYLAFSFPAPSLSDKRSADLDVLCQLLAGDKTSYLYRKYKYDLRLVDSISASYYGMERLGLLGFYVTLDADKFDSFWAEFSKELPELYKIQFTESEFKRAKLSIEDSLFRSKETMAGLASKLGYFQFFSGGEEGEVNYLSQINDVAMHNLKNVAEQTLKPSQLSVSMVIPDKESLDKVAKDKAAKDEAAKDKTINPLLYTPSELKPALEAKLEQAWALNKEAQSEQLSQQVGKPEIIELGANRKLVLTVDNTLPYTSVDVYFNGGDSLLSPEQEGLATFVASNLTRGTKKLPNMELETYVADRAADFGASAGRQSFSISLNYPSRFNADMFSLLQDTLTNPSFEQAELSRVKENQSSAIKMKEDQALGLAFRRLFPFLFGKHSYGLMQAGTLESVAKFNRADVLEFWSKQSQMPWVVSVCGNFNRDEIIAAVKALPVPTLAKPEVPLATFTPEKNLDFKMPGRNQSHLLLVFETAQYNNADTPALDLLNEVLAGQSGLLFRELRDVQGLGYTVTSMNWQGEKAGFIAFYIGTEPEKMAQAEAGFRTIIKELQDKPLDEKEVLRGKKQLEGSYYLGHQSIASRGGEAGTMALLGYELDRPRKNIDLANKVSPADLQKLAKKYLKLDQARIVKVLP